MAVFGSLKVGFFSLWNIISAIFWFLHPLSLKDIWNVATIGFNKVITDKPEDDRRNSLDKSVQILAKTPQDNLITKYILS